SPSNCAKVSNGMMASRSLLWMCSAPGTCCSASRMKNCASTRANAGTAIWYRHHKRRLRGHFCVDAAPAAFIALLASGFSPVYPCHVPPKDMRTHPIGTGPFKFVEFKPNLSIKVTKNLNYWKPGRPYLDGIEYTIIRNLSTAILAFVAGNVDMTFRGSVTVPLMKDVKNQLPQAICELAAGNVARNLLVNRDVPPFDNPELRRAMALSLDRKAFIDIVTEGQGNVGGIMQP